MYQFVSPFQLRARTALLTLAQTHIMQGRVSMALGFHTLAQFHLDRARHALGALPKARPVLRVVRS